MPPSPELIARKQRLDDLISLLERDPSAADQIDPQTLELKEPVPTSTTVVSDPGFIAHGGEAVETLPGRALTAAGNLYDRISEDYNTHRDQWGVPIGGPLLGIGRALFKGNNWAETGYNIADAAGRTGAMLAGAAPGFIAAGPSGAAIGASGGSAAWDELNRGLTALGVPPMTQRDQPNSWDDVKRDLAYGIVDNLAMIAPIEGARALAAKLPPPVVGPPKPVPNIAAAEASPDFQRAMRVGYGISNAEPSSRPLSAKRLGNPKDLQGYALKQAQDVHAKMTAPRVEGQPSEAARLVGQKIGAYEASDAASKSRAARWNQSGDDVVELGILQEGLPAPEAAAKAQAFGQQTWDLKTAAAQRVDGAYPKGFSAAAIEPYVQKVVAQIESLNRLPLTEAVAADMRNALDSVAKAFNPQKLLAPGSLSATEMVELTKTLNWIEREMMDLFDNPAMASQINANATAAGVKAGPLGFKQSATAISAARDGINAVLDGAGAKIGLGDKIFSRLNKQYQAARLLDDIMIGQMQGTNVAGAEKPMYRAMQPTNAQGANSNPATGMAAAVSGRAGNAMRVYEGAKQMLGIGPEPVPQGMKNARANMGREARIGSTVQDMLALGQGPVPRVPQMLPPPNPYWVEFTRGAAQGAVNTLAQVRPEAPIGAAGLLPPARELDPNVPRMPRDINALSPEIVIGMIQKVLPAKDAYPLIAQAAPIFQRGDEQEIGQFMGLLARHYPQLPIEKGPISGLPSEMQIAAGKSKLYDPQDKVRYEQLLRSSNLGIIEKALRMNDLKRHGFIYDLNTKLEIGPVNPGVKAPDSPHFQGSVHTPGWRQ